MAGILRPSGAKSEVKIKIVNTQNRDNIDANTLINGKIDINHFAKMK